MEDSNTSGVRRKSVHGEHVKHRRTRTGCYTCRTRRVKCDEGKPICERCRKGGRDCSYPDPPSTTKSGRRRSKVVVNPVSASPNGSSEGEAEEDYSDADLDDGPVVRDDLTQTADGKTADFDQSHSGGCSSERRSSTLTRKPSKTPSLTQERTPESSNEGSLAYAGPLPSTMPSATAPQHLGDSSGASLVGPTKDLDWSHLSPSLQFYLDYYQKHITIYTYSFRHEAEYFLHKTLIGLALRHKPLLYAVVGFAAFQRTITRPEGQIQDFLGYYTTSVTHLRASLSSHQPHSVATLVTILQLATIEEYLGDWVNLKSHQKAAYKILVELYSPETMMLTYTDRAIFDWYSRFDLFAGFLAGSETVLSRDWFVTYQQHYIDQAQQNPDDLLAKMEEVIATHRFLAMELMFLFAGRAKGRVDEAEFLRVIASMTEQFYAWKENLDPRLTDPVHRVTDFTGARERDPDDIVDPCTPGVLFGRDLWRMNNTLLGWCSSGILLKQQTAQLKGTAPPADIVDLAYQICQRYEAIEYWPGSPTGSLIAAQTTLGVAVLVLPKDERYMMWFRRKFAQIESMGYIYAPTFRTRMATFWSLPDIHRWWLPADQLYPPIIRSIRSFIDDRTLPSQDTPSSDLKEMKGIFRAMKIRDDEEPPVPGAPEKPVHHAMDLDRADHAGEDMNVDELAAPHEPLVVSGSPEAWDLPPDEDGAAFLHPPRV